MRVIYDPSAGDHDPDRRYRHATAALVIVVAGLALALGFVVGQAYGQTIPDCGGEGMRHTVPEGGFARCQGSRVLQDGLRWSVIVEVHDDGQFGARFTRPAPAPADIFVELEAHLGGSGNGEAGVLTGALPAGQTQVTLAGRFDPAVLVPWDCITQTDAKAINGEADKPLPPNQNRVRIAGGWFVFENCAPPPTTTTTTPETTAPTTAPQTSPTTPGPGAPTTTAGTTSTVPPPGGSSVPAGSASTLPATGGNPIPGALAGGIGALCGGLFALWVARRTWARHA